MEPDVALSPGDLPTKWRDRAQFLLDYGDPNTARLWQLAAAELERALRVLGEETLTLVEAARLSGYTADYIGALVRHGKLANHGRRKAPRVRRSDLPIKNPNTAGRPRRERRPDHDDIASIVSKLRDKGDQ